jgi:hypothetical protein
MFTPDQPDDIVAYFVVEAARLTGRRLPSRLRGNAATTSEIS